MTAPKTAAGASGEAKAAHTPGPWRLDDTFHADLVEIGYHFIDAGRGFYGSGAHGFGICGLLSLTDARLIAAAPDLLEALKAWDAAIPRIDEFGDVSPNSLRGKARAAIARAEGA